MKPLLDAHRDLLKPEVIWNIEEGLKLTAADIIHAEQQRADMYHRTLAFFETYDLLLCPATIVPPFPVENRYVEECDGHKFSNYFEWMTIVSAITMVCCPAISIPAGFTRENLPVGIQMVAPPRAEAQLLAGAKLLEDILDAALKAPIDPRSGS
jgi:amidase